MDFSKYNQVPTEFATASAIGLAAATLGAMARRGLVEVLDTKPKQYRRISNPAIKVYQLVEEHMPKDRHYFTINKKDRLYGMLCSMKQGKIVDCWGEEYDLTDVVSVQLGKRLYFVEE